METRPGPARLAGETLSSRRAPSCAGDKLLKKERAFARGRRRADRDTTKVRTYDIVASAIINLRAGQRSMAEVPDPVEAAA